MTRTRKPKPLTVTPQMVLKHLRGKRAKYGNVKVQTDDGVIDSKKEARRWAELQILEQNQQVFALSRDRKRCTFSLRGIDRSIVCTYIADFCYIENQQNIVEDCKGLRTPLYKLKRKLFIAQYKHFTHRES